MSHRLLRIVEVSKADDATSSFAVRLAWMCAIWACSVGALAAVAFVLRAALK